MISIRVLARPFIATRSGPGGNHYIAEFHRRLLEILPASFVNAPDAEPVAVQPPTLDDLRRDSALAAALREALIPVDEYSGKLEPLPDRTVSALERGYPIVSGETILQVALHYLPTCFNGLRAGTCVFERESDRSLVCLALADFAWDLATGTVLPSRLPSFAPRVERSQGSVPKGLHTTALTAAAQDDSSAALLRSIGSISLDVFGTLSWATPAGPFVSAAITIFQAVLGDEGPSLIDQISDLSVRVVENITQFIEDKNLVEAFDALKVFAEWTSLSATELNLQSPETYRFHLTEPEGILAVINGQLGPNVKNNLFGLVTILSADVEPDLGDGDAYADAHRRSIAEAKLHLFFFALALYLTTLKLKMGLVAKLFAFGYDEHGAALDLSDPKNANPDNTFQVFLVQLAKFRDVTLKMIERVRRRRLAQVFLEEAWCEVAYSQETKPVARRGEWAINAHDALYRGPKNDQLVRDKQDGPTTAEFHYGGDERDSLGRSHGKPYVYFYWWKRTEIRDHGVDNGVGAQDFVLCNGDWGSYSYEPNTERARGLRDAYRQRVAAAFDAWGKVPKILEATFEGIQQLWVPKLPAQFPGPGALFVESWMETAKPGSIWTNPLAEVRYRISVTSTAGLSSGLSDDRTSSSWIAPGGKAAPRIVGLPSFSQGAAPESFKYVDVMRLHREFRIAHPDGSYRTLPATVVASFGRDDNNAFPTIQVDTRSTSRDERALSDI